MKLVSVLCFFSSKPHFIKPHPPSTLESVKLFSSASLPHPQCLSTSYFASLTPQVSQYGLLVLLSCWVMSDLVDCSPPGSMSGDFPGKNTGVGCHFLLHMNSKSPLFQLHCNLFSTLYPISLYKMQIWSCKFLDWKPILIQIDFWWYPNLLICFSRT